MLGLVSCDGCKKETNTESVPAPPEQGGAIEDMVNTNIGMGLGYGASMAPTSARFDRVYVVDDKTAFVVGTSLEETIALRTTDGGRTWESLRTKAGVFASWNVNGDGAAALIGGDRKKVTVRAGELAPVEKAQIWFAPRGRTLSEPAPLFPNDEKHKDVTIERGFAMPAILSGELAGVVVDRARSPVILFGAPGGQQQPEPVDGARARLVAAPYGRPAQLLVESGGAIEVQPWPKPGDKVQTGTKIAALPSIPNVFEQLGEGPGCDNGKYSFARVAAGANNAWIVGIAPQSTFAFKAPPGEEKRIGCGADAVVVETFDTKKNVPQLVRCPFDGKCAEPKSQPFDIWPVKHERKILATTTKQGVVAVMSAKAGARWGVYLATSTDKGNTFALPRVIGEGQTDRGFFDVAAVIGFPDRIVILFTADVTGTRRRGWYVLASDDGGENWQAP